MNHQELIERLRKAVISPFDLGPVADAIESLLAENERLNAELAKYRDAFVVASAAVSNSSDTFRPIIKFDYGVELRMAVPASGKPIALIVKPGENK